MSICVNYLIFLKFHFSFPDALSTCFVIRPIGSGNGNLPAAAFHSLYSSRSK